MRWLIPCFRKILLQKHLKVPKVDKVIVDALDRVLPRLDVTFLAHFDLHDLPFL